MSQPAFEALADRSLLPQGQAAVRHVLVRVVAPVRAGHERLPLNLAFVLDRSGSMSGGKLALAQASALQALEAMKPCDRASVVLYNHAVELRLPSTPVTQAAREQARAALAEARASGNTALFDGWLRGCEQVAAHLDGRGLARCLLLTDGLANQGLTDAAEIVRHVEELARRGVATSTFGVGEDFDEQLLADMSRAGQGRFHYVQEEAQIDRFVRAELGEALETVATHVQLVVEAPASIQVEPLNAYAAQPAPGATAFQVGALASGEELTLVLRLSFPAGAGPAEVRLSLRDQEGVLGNAAARLAFRPAAPHEAAAEPPAPAPLLAAAELLAARARREAAARNRQRLYEQATLDLRLAARAARALLPGHPVLEALAAALDGEAREFSSALRGFDIKRKFMNASYASLGRTRGGRAPAARHVPLALLTADPAFQPLLEAVFWSLAAADPLLGPARFEPVRADQWGRQPGPDRTLGSGLLSLPEEKDLVERVSRSNPDAALVMVFVPRPLADNWFSHWHRDAATALVSTFGWERTAGVPLAAFVAYELLHHGLRRLGPQYQPEEWAHAETRGCMFDFCRLKPEIEIKLQTAALCDECWKRLLAAGAPMDSLERLLDVVRELAHAAPGLSPEPCPAVHP